MASPFDYVNDASFSKNGVWDDEVSEKEYVPFLANRAFSYHVDTVLDANIVNMLPVLSPKMQYDYYLNTVSSRRRFGKWGKRDNSSLTLAVQHELNVSATKAKEILSFLTEDQKKECLTRHKARLNDEK